MVEMNIRNERYYAGCWFGGAMWEVRKHVAAGFWILTKDDVKVSTWPTKRMAIAAMKAEAAK